jgi:hypothetical protein
MKTTCPKRFPPGQFPVLHGSVHQAEPVFRVIRTAVVAVIKQLVPEDAPRPFCGKKDDGLHNLLHTVLYQEKGRSFQAAKGFPASGLKSVNARLLFTGQGHSL